MSQPISNSVPANPFATKASDDLNPFAAVRNPFLAPSTPPEAEVAAPWKGDTSDLDLVSAETVSVEVRWNDTVLHVAHLSPVRPFFVGEGTATEMVDFHVPSAQLGAPRLAVVAPRGDKTVLVLQPKAEGTVTLRGSVTRPIQAFMDQAMPSTTYAGAVELELPMGASAVVRYGDISLAVSVEFAAKPMATGLLSGTDRAPFVFGAMSAVAHTAMVAAFAFFMPSMSGGSAEDVDAEKKQVMQKYLSVQASAETPKVEKHDEASAAQGGGETGPKAAGVEGASGAKNAPITNGRIGVAKRDDGPLRLQDAMAEAKQFGIIGMIPALFAKSDPHAPSIWGGTDSNGNDARSAQGLFMGDEIGDSRGNGGLGITGPGEGGGGPAHYIGLTNFGPGGTATRPGREGGMGNCPPGSLCGSSQTSRTPGGPSLGLTPTVTTGGRLPPEVIQRVIRQNFGRYRACYESALRQNPELKGRATTAFQISQSGAVSFASTSGDLPGSVLSCIQASFQSLSFPAPEGGSVNVVYPIVFNPS